jgi:hypothetical protein
MQIKVTFPGSFTVFNPDDAGDFLKALSKAQVIDSSGWGDNETLKLSKYKPQVEFIDNLDFAPLPTPLVELQERLRASEKAWLEYYNKFTTSEKKVKELKEKFEGIKAKVCPEDIEL